MWLWQDAKRARRTRDGLPWEAYHAHRSEERRWARTQGHEWGALLGFWLSFGSETLPSVRQNRAHHSHHIVFLWFNLLKKVLEKGFFGQWGGWGGGLYSLEKNIH